MDDVRTFWRVAPGTEDLRATFEALFRHIAATKDSAVPAVPAGPTYHSTDSELEDNLEKKPAA